MAADEDVRESWYEVEREGISHVGSSEEVAEMLAEAVTEHQKKGLDQPLSFAEGTSTEDEEQPLVFSCEDTTPQASSWHELSRQEYHHKHYSEKQGFLHNLIVSLKEFLKSFFNPVVIASHLAALGIGVYIGRRMVS